MSKQRTGSASLIKIENVMDLKWFELIYNVGMTYKFTKGLGAFNNKLYDIPYQFIFLCLCLIVFLIHYYLIIYAKF